MSQFFGKLKPVQSWRWSQAARLLMQKNAEHGVILRDQEAIRAVAGIQALVLDVSLLMEGWNAVRMVAAPLTPCGLDKFRRQGSWMMLTAGVALGCGDYAPLEDFAREMNFAWERMARQYPKVSALPYDETRRMETTIHRDAGGLRAYAKGEPDAVISCCGHLMDGQTRPFEAADKERALATARRMEAQGLLTLAFATKWLEAPGPYEEDMVFLGIVGTGDMVKPGVPEACAVFHRMGVRPVLVTERALPDGAVMAGGLPWTGAGILRHGDIAALEGQALWEAARDACAFLEVPEGAKSGVLRALRSDRVVAALAPASEGGMTLSLGQKAVGEAYLSGNKLMDVARLIQSCGALVSRHPG